MGSVSNTAEGIPLRNYDDENIFLVDTLHLKSKKRQPCGQSCNGYLVDNPTITPPGPRSPEQILADAEPFLTDYYESLGSKDSKEHKLRWKEVQDTVKQKGTYDLTYPELEYAGRQAWRNAARCMGRAYWRTLKVFDFRHCKTAKDMYDCICEELEYGQNNGKIRPSLGLFPARTDGKHDYRAWNVTTCAYAGYKHADGTIVGESRLIEFTKICEKLGWKGEGGHYDLLPLLLQANGEDPELFYLPEKLLCEVEIKHPINGKITKLGLRTPRYATGTFLKLDAGGLEFPGTIFVAWYTSPEVSTRLFCNKNHGIPAVAAVAECMGLDTTKPEWTWKDRAAAEINYAVINSYQESGTTILDQYTASESFVQFMREECKMRGGAPADWVWIVPPIGGNMTSVWHQEMIKYHIKPSLDNQPKGWEYHKWKNPLFQEKKLTRFKSLAWVVRIVTSFVKKVLSRRPSCLILYASESGRAENYSYTAANIFESAFNVKATCMSNYNVSCLSDEPLILVIASTFGNGDPPENGKVFARALSELTRTTDRKPLQNCKYSVFGLGSSLYPTFCGFGKHLMKELQELGGQPILPLAMGDDLGNQKALFKEWIRDITTALEKAVTIKDKNVFESANKFLKQYDMSWEPGKFRLCPVNKESSASILEGLEQFRKVQLIPMEVIEKQVLTKNTSEEKFMLRLGKKSTFSKDFPAYKAGEHICIFPANNSELVDGILQRVICEQPPDKLVKEQIKHKDVNGEDIWSYFNDVPLYFTYTTRTILTHGLDLTSTPSQALLAKVAMLDASSEDKRRLKELSEDQGKYEEWKHSKYPNWLEILEEFPSLKMPIEFLITQASPLSARYYSISSSPIESPEGIDITVALVHYKTHEGKDHSGVSSNWLRRITTEITVPCLIKPASEFHMCSDLSKPIIMVGIGAGIAPLRGFWRERKAISENEKNCRLGQMTLFFGCRRSDQDHIYKDEMEKMLNDGILSAVHVAYSREPGKKKVYVQHLILEQGSAVYKQLFQDGGHIYICGDVVMADDIRSTLRDIIVKHGKVDHDTASAHFDQLKKDGRLHEDIFGIPLKSFKSKERSTSKNIH